GLQPVRTVGSLSTTLGGFLRSKSLLPVVSDFLFENPKAVLDELALLNATHDVFIVLIDGAFAYELPRVSAGWIEMGDVEAGAARMISRSAYRKMATRIREWQADVRAAAKDHDLDVVEVGLDQAKADVTLSEFVAERRLRKTYS